MKTSSPDLALSAMHAAAIEVALGIAGALERFRTSAGLILTATSELAANPAVSPDGQRQLAEARDELQGWLRKLDN